MILVDGQPVDTVNVRDRGLAYGDGVFRTVRTQAGRALWWPDQYAKLAADGAVLALECPDADCLSTEIGQVAEAGEGVVKIILTRGTGARGYAYAAGGAGTRVVLSAPLPWYAQSDASADVSARWCTLQLARQPRLAGIKHLNRLENVLARAEWNNDAILEGILCDDSGAVIGGVMSNLFWAKDGDLYTPDLTGSGVAGVARARLLRVLKQRGMRVHIGRWLPQAILAADEVMICNSVIGVRRVSRLDDATWSPAGWTTTLNNALYENPD